LVRHAPSAPLPPDSEKPADTASTRAAFPRLAPLHFEGAPKQRDPCPFAFVYIVWQESLHNFHKLLGWFPTKNLSHRGSETGRVNVKGNCREKRFEGSQGLRLRQSSPVDSALCTLQSMCLDRRGFRRPLRLPVTNRLRFRQQFLSKSDRRAPGGLLFVAVSPRMPASVTPGANGDGAER
jgi:hypothetical protein